MIRYFFEDFKKTWCCRRAPLTNDVLERVVAIKQVDGKMEEEVICVVPPRSRDQYDREFVKMETKRLKEENIPVLRGNPCSFCLMNTPTAAGGVRAWPGARAMGVRHMTKDQQKELRAKEQKLGDGELCLLTYRNIHEANFEVGTRKLLGCAKCVRHGQRVHQGPENIRLEFKDKDHAHYRGKSLNKDGRDKKKDHLKEDFKVEGPGHGTDRDSLKHNMVTGNGRVYMQVDGEYFVCMFPKSVTATWKQRIQVMSKRAVTDIKPPCICCPRG